MGILDVRCKGDTKYLWVRFARVLMSSLRKSKRQTIRRNYKDLHESGFNTSVSMTSEDEKLDIAAGEW